ncbi:hypothetical protein ROJ8625_02618 [Roseivivax jejudonensis]|uniref:VWA-like domain-containing protein n=1 Tax=Roseivivax jejudonensis TaxID=1529041 RepID=A0A1X6ZIV9_9RHOB|nr:VWA-like domain-containing protein [Roseivivax jejudonensis]SLN52112.1 hypothetical protein ROJ8625_02618 [Roseivivax jejudonensis]
MIHSSRARTALGHLGEVDPGLATLALWCTHRDDPGPTRTEGETIRYGPGFDTRPVAEQVGIAAHHVLHVALRHGPRADAMADRIGSAFDPALYALAADAIVNDTLTSAGHTLPRPRVSLVELLDEIGEATGTPAAALAEWDADRLALRLHHDAGTMRRAGDYGAARAFVSDLAPGQGGTAHQDAETWAGHLERALSVGRGAGSGIGAVLGRLADSAPPRIAWERRLRRLLARALIEAPRPTWRRPSGRWAAADALARGEGREGPPVAPGRQRMTEAPRVVAAIDTSSSVDTQMLGLFAAELRGVARRSGAETWVLGFDDDVHFEEKLAPGAAGLPDLVEMRTGGGTDFGPLMARCRTLGPSVVVVMTDLDAPLGPPPRFPVVWVTPRGAPEAPFGAQLFVS